jgi:microsomal dipeptidase-like Zn-dependent dipeptidase
VVDLVGAERLLFGSDFPLLLYPSKSRERDMTRFVTQMTGEAGLTDQELSAVMGGNLRRILKLP